MTGDTSASFAIALVRGSNLLAQVCSIHRERCTRNGLNLPVNAWYNSRTLTRWRLVEACQPHF
jgi:hypothetical protein